MIESTINAFGRAASSAVSKERLAYTSTTVPSEALAVLETYSPMLNPATRIGTLDFHRERRISPSSRSSKRSPVATKRKFLGQRNVSSKSAGLYPRLGYQLPRAPTK